MEVYTLTRRQTAAEAALIWFQGEHPVNSMKTSEGGAH